MKFFCYFKRKAGHTKRQVLREKFRNFVLELKVRGFSEKTIDQYVYYNGRFLDFVKNATSVLEHAQKSPPQTSGIIHLHSGDFRHIKKEPRGITSGDIKQYLNYLVINNAQPRTVNMAINSLKAYYEGFLRKKLFTFIKRAKIPKDMPNVLSKDEIKAMIDNTNFLKHKLLIELLYSSGIRVGECVKIKIDNIDTNEKIIFIKEGKGKKDRFVITSKRFIEDLKEYLTQRKKQLPYLFDNGYDSHISIRTAEEIVKLAAKRAGIKKRVYPHLLRASFATHLFEENVQEHKIQKLMGHARRDTTLGYIKTRTDDLKMIKSPLD